jgi:hypothetical protein
MSDIQEEMKKQYKRAEENDIKLLQEKNKKLKELCDKYEEEHNNEFQCWKRDRKELLDKRNRINKAIEYMSETLECNYHGANITFDELIHNTKNILQGSDKE